MLRIRHLTTHKVHIFLISSPAGHAPLFVCFFNYCLIISFFYLQQQILRNSMFGNTLSEVMDLQKDKFPLRKLPWIQTTLSEHVSNNPSEVWHSAP